MANQQQQPQLRNEIVAWFQQQPPVTRFLFSASILITVAGKFIFSPNRFILYWPDVFGKLQVGSYYVAYWTRVHNLRDSLTCI